MPKSLEEQKELSFADYTAEFNRFTQAEVDAEMSHNKQAAQIAAVGLDRLIRSNHDNHVGLIASFMYDEEYDIN